MARWLRQIAFRLVVAALMLGLYPLACGLAGYCLGYHHALQQSFAHPEGIRSFIPWQPAKLD